MNWKAPSILDTEECDNHVTVGDTGLEKSKIVLPKIVFNSELAFSFVPTPFSFLFNNMVRSLRD